MARLVVNPGSPSAWEIELKPGPNFIGRGFANDVKIPDPSVSGSHCQILVDNLSVMIKDLGSTNGTFVNRSSVREASLQPGQTIHVGGVEILFVGDDPGNALVPPPPTMGGGGTPAASAPPMAPRTALRPAYAAAPAAAATAVQAPPVPPPIAAPAAAPASGNCKHHPRTAGRFFCNQCQVYYCELCVTSRNLGGISHKFCRHCGAECVAVQVQLTRPAGRKSFFGLLPGALIYPFRGTGLLMLLCYTLMLAAMGFISTGMFSILAKIVAFGYLFCFMQNLIHATANEEREMPDLPGFDDVFGGAFRLAGTVVICFWLPIALEVMKAFFDVDVPVSAIIATMVLGCLYFPMAFLAVAMKDTVLAANPLVVFPAILKVPAEYIVTAIVLVSVYGVRQLGDWVMILLKYQSYSTKDMGMLLTGFALRAFWSLVSVYLLTVSMRILGLLYVTKKERFGWFSR